jgi:phospholipid/cholesterol/gamma-HCH transport system substrate-binding protein
MENRARYALIGAFVAGCLLAGFAFVYWIANTGGLGRSTVYAVRFNEPIGGITPGASVLFNGVRVGAVSSIKLDPNEPRQVTALLSVDPATPVRADTAVTLSFQGFTGAPAIALKGGAADAPRLVAKNGQPPLLIAAPGAAESLSDSARTAVKRIDELIEQNAKPLNTAITGIASFADVLGRNSQRVESLLGGLETLTGTGKKEGSPTYDLSAANDFSGLSQTIPAQLVVGDVTALLVFDSQRIQTRTAAGTYAAVADAQWADTLPKLVQAKLLQSFENARQIGSVSRPLDQITPEYRLELGIRLFEAGPENAAKVEIAARLVSDKGAVKAARIFAASAPGKSAEAVDVVAALDVAFRQVAGEIVRWTVAEAQGDDAPQGEKKPL